MKLSDYLNRYQLLQVSIQNDERLLSMINQNSYGLLLSRLSMDGPFSQEGKKLVSELVLNAETLKKRIRHKNRLLEKYTLRIAKAASLIESEPIRDYVIKRYLYGFTHEAIAEASFYSLRQVYRQASIAKKELFKKLLLVMPKAKKIPPKRFRSSCFIIKKEYQTDPITIKMRKIIKDRKFA